MADVLENKATIDALTGLNNLRHMSDHLEQLINQAVRDGQPLSLVVADLDHFKPINDTYGHAAGDRVLQAIGAAMLRWSRDEFICWRLGGDEFAIALPNNGSEPAAHHAESLRRLINSLSVRVQDGVVQPRVSVGVASCPQDGDSVGTLLGMADRRMYEAKRLYSLAGAEAAGRLSA
jgi:diguanylate cyclase (GGDEF)-like protein